MSIIENIDHIRKKISVTEKRFKRRKSSVSLLAVSKTRSVETIITAINQGQLHFGENYCQEAVAKIEAINNMEVYAESTRDLTLQDLLYFKKEHPSSPNYKDEDPTNPFDFPWHNSRYKLLYAPRLIENDEMHRNIAANFREDFYENRKKHYDEYMERTQ